MTSDMSKRNNMSDFPCSLIIKTPFPTHRLATTALQALQVDEELSPLVRRTFSLITPPTSPISSASSASSTDSTTDLSRSPQATSGSSPTVLLTEYRAKTNRMLRVAVNGFMESLGVVLGVMEKLDVDVLAQGRSSNGSAKTTASAAKSTTGGATAATAPAVTPAHAPKPAVKE